MISKFKKAVLTSAAITGVMLLSPSAMAETFTFEGNFTNARKNTDRIVIDNVTGTMQFLGDRTEVTVQDDKLIGYTPPASGKLFDKATAIMGNITGQIYDSAVDHVFKGIDLHGEKIMFGTGGSFFLWASWRDDDGNIKGDVIGKWGVFVPPPSPSSP